MLDFVVPMTDTICDSWFLTIMVFFVLPQAVLFSTYLYGEYLANRDLARTVKEWDERDAAKLLKKETAHG